MFILLIIREWSTTTVFLSSVLLQPKSPSRAFRLDGEHFLFSQRLNIFFSGCKLLWHLQICLSPRLDSFLTRGAFHLLTEISNTPRKAYAEHTLIPLQGFSISHSLPSPPIPLPSPSFR
ncbi:hypothetical protein BS17DRAFT_365527 [Gyrodon lividus]|nr:hypothetical protein BS17DRAFT_365527 [Gyrodon lividus]